MAGRKHILVVDDERDLVELLVFNLGRAGFETSTVTAGGPSSPTLRGFWKWSISCSGYIWSNVDMLQVVAAIIEREGNILVGQRTSAQSHPLQWEFPGGKVEAGESPEQALTRELEEELAIRVGASKEITRYPYAYPGKNPIELIFLRVTSYEGEPRNLIFHDLQWQPKLRLAELDFLAGDRDFLRGIYTETYGDSNQKG